MSRTAGLAGLLCALVLGAVLGAWSAVHLSNQGFGRGDVVQVGPWQTSLIIGSSAADPWTRANVARTGLLALPREENIYFIATTDSTGAALEADRTYIIEGPIPPVGWWSLGAYDREHFLFPSDGAYFSVSDDANPGQPDRIRVQVGGQQPSGDWIETSGRGAMSLTLRLYQHSGWDKADLQALELPRIRRVEAAP